MNVRILHWKRALRSVLLVLLLSVAGMGKMYAQEFTMGNLNYSVNDDGISVSVTGPNFSGEGFENEIPSDWATIDADGDGYGWEIASWANHTGNYGMASASYLDWVGAVTPDNYLVSGPINFTTNTGIRFYACANDVYFAAEHFGVAVSLGSQTNAEEFSTITEWTMTAKGNVDPSRVRGLRDQTTWYEYTVDLSGFDGQTGYVAIRHFNCTDQWYLNVDDVYIGDDYDTPALNIPENVSFEGVSYGVTTIENSAFKNCSFYTGELTIPNSVTTIGNSAFQDCSGFSGNLTIPNSVTTIGNEAFFGCSGFTGSLTIGNSVTTIGDYAFRDCSGFTGDLVVPNSVTTIGGYAFYGCNGFTGSLTIGNSVTSIGDHAFMYCWGFTGSLNLPNSVTTIGSRAFSGCSGLTGDLTIPNSVTEIGDCAFLDCSGFTGSLTIGNSVTTIGDIAFSGCSGLEQIIVDSENTTYDSRENCNAIIETGSNILIQGCNNSVIPNSVTMIGEWAFYGCSGLTGSLTLPNSVTTISEGAFYGCSGLTGSLTLPNSVTSIGEMAFEGCSGFTGSLTIPNSVTSIGNWTFYGCSGLTGSLTIPNSVTTIGEEAFYNCSGLTGSLTLPNSVTTIGDYAFFGCYGLSEIIVLRVTPPSLNAYYYTNNCPIYVLYESLDDYKTAWSSYASRIFPMAYTTVAGYGEGEGNYRFIASPLVEDTDPTTVDNMITETAYDLYRFDQSEELEWQNYKYPENTPNFFLTNGQGYLYANAEDVNLIFKGAFNGDDTKEVSLAYDATATFAGWNLVGNPFPVNAYANKSYYTMNEEGTAIEPNMVSSVTAIPACTGVLVMAEAEGEAVVFSTEAPEAANNQGCLQITVAQTTTRGNAIQDKAIVSFNAGDRLEKFVFGRNDAQISIPQGGKDYAIAFSDKKSEMPVNFVTNQNGTYTLSLGIVDADMDYLHLIDNMTGTDVDLLTTPSYTFEAKTTDYASRFRLLFSADGAENGPSTGSASFAYYDGSAWVVSNEGQATVQVVDALGRVLSTETISGNASISVNQPAGVYMLRLINGEAVKTQKIVVR